MSRMTCVATFRTRLEAEMARGLLEVEGIPAIVAADDAGGWRPDLPLVAGGVRLLVRAEDEAAAREILARVPEDPPQPPDQA